MEFNLFFNLLILVLIGFFLFLNIKTYNQTLRISEISKQKYLDLKCDFVYEEKMSKINTQNIVLLDELDKSLFERLFKITQDILLIQKIILDNHFQ